MMMDRFDMLETTLASTQASLLSLGNRMTEVENANSSFDHRLASLEQTCIKMREENAALSSKGIDLEALKISALKSHVTHFQTEVQHFTGLGPANHGPADATGRALLVQVSLQGTFR
ncbi:hypothetical protein MHYP_G00092530 [Metynnis hypsauchen]